MYSRRDLSSREGPRRGYERFYRRFHESRSYLADTRLAVKLSLGAGLPLLAATLWGLFASPTSAGRVPDFVHFGVQILVLGSAALALYQMRHTLALSFSAIAIANAALMRVWHQ